LDVNEQLYRKNHQLCQRITRAALDFYKVTSSELDNYIEETEAKDQKGDRVSVSQALKHYVRDWSSEGVHERKTFSCVIDTVDVYAPTIEQRIVSPLKVLVPGAGLGRLAYEIAELGGTYFA